MLENRYCHVMLVPAKGDVTRYDDPCPRSTTPFFVRGYLLEEHYYIPLPLFYFFSHTFAFQLLDKPWSQVSTLLPPSSCLQFLPRIGFSNPTARRLFIECCSLTLSRFPQFNLCRRKSPTEFFTSMHSAGLELTKLTYIYQARG